MHHEPVLGGQVFAHRSQRFGSSAVIEPDARQHTKAIRLDEDLAFLALLRSDFLSEAVVGAQKPFAIPPVLLQSVSSILSAAVRKHVASSALAVAAGDRRQFVRSVHEQSGDEHRLGDLAILIRRGLE